MADNSKASRLHEMAMEIDGRADWWRYPTEDLVKGFLGEGPVFIVSDQPSIDPWEPSHPHRRAYYDVLASLKAGGFHLTDLYKRRGPAGELKRGIPADFAEH